MIGQVYANDKHCKEVKLSPEERLLYHQTHSHALMDALRLWLNNQLTYELNEPNSGLGEVRSIYAQALDTAHDIFTSGWCTIR